MNGEGINGKLLLCDAAEVAQSKLFILGAGWTVIRADAPFNMALAALFFVPWNDANRQIDFRILLLDFDGKDVQAPDGQPVRVEGQFEVGRMPGTRQGATLVTPLAVPVVGITLAKGVYRWELYVGHTILDSATFDVV